MKVTERVISNQFGEEAMLIRRAQAGDRAAFDHLTRRYRGMIMAVAYVRLGDRDEAEDLAQEILARVWVKLATLQEPCAFPGWLKTICIRTAQNRRQRRPPTPVSLDEMRENRLLAASEGDPLTGLLVGEQRRQWQQALAALPPENRLVIVLHVVEGFTCVELAELLGVPLTTVEGRVHRAKGQLKRLLRDDILLRE